jgi:hypothetical protein
MNSALVQGLVRHCYGRMKNISPEALEPKDEAEAVCDAAVS